MVFRGIENCSILVAVVSVQAQLFRGPTVYVHWSDVLKDPMPIGQSVAVVQTNYFHWSLKPKKRKVNVVTKLGVPEERKGLGVKERSS